MNQKTLLVLSLIGAAALLSANNIAAQTVSVQISTFADHNLSSSTPAGVLNVAGFQPEGPNTGFTQDTPSEALLSASNLLTSTGANSGIGFTYNYNAGSTSNQGNGSSSYNKLMDDQLFTESGKGNPASVLTFSGLSAVNSYNLFVYLSSPFFFGTNSSTISLDGGTALDFTTDNSLSAYTQITGTNADGNYVEFDGLSGALPQSVSLGEGFAGISGFQLETAGAAAAPEPSTWAMMLGGLGFLAFVGRRVRRA
jgi:hypothetical protein